MVTAGTINHCPRQTNDTKYSSINNDTWTSDGLLLAAQKDEGVRQMQDTTLHVPVVNQLKSQKSVNTTKPLNSSPSGTRREMWERWLPEISAVVKMGLIPAKSLSAWFNQPWLCWRSLNRLHTGVGWAKMVMRRWGCIDKMQSVKFDSREDQRMPYLLCCWTLDSLCTLNAWRWRQIVRGTRKENCPSLHHTELICWSCLTPRHYSLSSHHYLSLTFKSKPSWKMV